jgi:protein TonB
VSPPRVIEQPEPKFSDEARKAGYHGIETLSVIVDASGRATRVMIVTPLGLGLDEKAVEAVRRWKFVPAKKGREPVAVKIRIEVDFNLN